MNFWGNRSLKQLGLLIMLAMFLVFFAQYVLIRISIDNLHEAEQKIDYARVAQIASVQVAFQTQAYLMGKKELAPQILANITKQDHRLKTLGFGGLIADHGNYLKPLPNLTKITYNSLVESWVSYKESTSLLLTEKETINATSSSSEPDSLGNVIQPLTIVKQNAGYSRAKINQEAQWLSLSGWFDILIADLEDDVENKKHAVIQLYGVMASINGLLIIGIYFLFRRHVLKQLAIFKVHTANNIHITDLGKNEIGQLGIQINEAIENLKDATDFVTAISEGNLSMDYKETLDEQYKVGKNKLADSLINMQAKLTQLNEEDRKRQWVNEGLAKFVDILRSSNDNITVLCDKIIAALSQYTQSSQGGLFILNDEDENNKYLEQISLFAFDLKKFEQRRIKLGEGILGQAFLEKETTYITELPDEYVRITSGLGDASPNCILMVPLKIDQEVYGIVELASFKAFAPYVIAFVEKLGETIAATLASVRAAEKNRHLIDQFQHQTEEMRAQEEEMRQNMEELEATQEESSRKEQGYIEQIAKLEGQTSVHSHELEAAKSKSLIIEKEYREKIEELEKKFALVPKQGDDWVLAQEVARVLKINLEALIITQEELPHKSGQN